MKKWKGRNASFHGIRRRNCDNPGAGGEFGQMREVVGAFWEVVPFVGTGKDIDRLDMKDYNGYKGNP